jgi:TatD DNase family protein
MKPDYIDIHSHLHFKDYEQDRELVLLRMSENNVATISIGIDLETSKKEVAIAEVHDNVYTCIGLHPADNDKETFDNKEFEALVKHPKVVAIGECGLDYGKKIDVTDEDKVRQRKDFESQIELAIKYDKPLMLHVRNAHEDVVDILASKKKEFGDKLRGNSHFFTSSCDIAQKYFDLGFTISFTGVITFTKDYDEVVRYAPLDRIMSETDSPFVAPAPYRGSRNEPMYVREVVKRIAELKEMPLEEVRETLVSNAIKAFKLPC